jgi:hypothetical protein
VSKLVDDPVLRAAQSHAARLSVATRTWGSRCDELIDHYESVLAAASAVSLAAGSPA